MGRAPSALWGGGLGLAVKVPARAGIALVAAVQGQQESQAGEGQEETSLHGDASRGAPGALQTLTVPRTPGAALRTTSGTMERMADESRAWRVHGRVQGVGFRYFVVRRAGQLGLRGWTRNLAGGDVEVQARGPAAALASLEASLMAGPAHAVVDRLEPVQPSQSLERTGSFTIEY